MEERSTLVDELRSIRANLNDALVAVHDLNIKFAGPTPKEAAEAKNPQVESIGSLIADIKRQSNILTSLLGTTHNFIGQVGGANVTTRMAGTAVAGY